MDMNFNILYTQTWTDVQIRVPMTTVRDLLQIQLTFFLLKKSKTNTIEHCLVK